MVLASIAHRLPNSRAARSCVGTAPTMACPARRKMDPAFPARAGMNRRWATSLRARRRVPRTRGDEPVIIPNKELDALIERAGEEVTEKNIVRWAREARRLAKAGNAPHSAESPTGSTSVIIQAAKHTLNRPHGRRLNNRRNLRPNDPVAW
jgi:hypothetical protein